tara:strand:- start:1378 stop:1578 length:201 start_codon:yes stop_codon:yes gene_type:complete
MNIETEVESYPEFEYNDALSYEDNFWRWRDMADYEAKSCNQPYYNRDEAVAKFQQMWGYKSKGVAL